LYFTLTHRFARDFKKLSAAEQSAFRAAARQFSEACDRVVAGSGQWPASLRVKSVEGALGVFEMTWSFAGPDGRATWEWTTIEVEEGGAMKSVRAVQWRRIGDHSVFKEP
jgi:hypothetical protein